MIYIRRINKQKTVRLSNQNDPIIKDLCIQSCEILLAFMYKILRDITYANRLLYLQVQTVD